MSAKPHARFLFDDTLDTSFRRALEAWDATDGTRRLWERDASLWTGADEARWLGWLEVLDAWQSGGQTFDSLPAALRNPELIGRAFSDVVVMGMGGSSLCPDVLATTFGRVEGSPRLRVLDSTVPAQVARLRDAIDLERTLFIVPSKSGSTIEPNSFKAYFWGALEAKLGAGQAGPHFLAITDPGTQLDALARDESFAATSHGIPEIGGRFSALSVFGMVPAQLMGADVAGLLARARSMAEACAAGTPAADNPGIALGVALGCLAKAGRDKLTLLPSPAIASLGGWLEQLIAESTGKHGVGIVPVDGEGVCEVERYGGDRVFVVLRLGGDDNAALDARTTALEASGHPVVRIELDDRLDLGQEFFRWEMATAAAGAVLGINPFDQPDVEAAKVVARELMGQFEAKGSLPAPEPLLREGALCLYAGEHCAGASSLEAALAAHLAALSPGDYFAINAYIEMCPENDRRLQELRGAVLASKGVATTVGYGPRFLHSTGQLHKGGPNNGVFLQLTCDDPEDLAIPGQRYSFGVLKSAQAEGDYQVLAERKRRIVRVHLGADVGGGLAKLSEVLRGALCS